MKTLDGNKLIAEFMGAYIAKEGQLAYDMDDKYPNGVDRLMPDEMKYHTSWDWLIPVVELCRERQMFGSQRLINNINKRLMDLDILAVHANVVDFIQFYNNK